MATITDASVPCSEAETLDSEVSCLMSHGITPEVAQTFGIERIQSGNMAGRIGIPIHDERGRVLAHAVVSFKGSRPKYSLEPAGFPKGRVLYNLHRTLQYVEVDSDRHVVVVEGLCDVIALAQIYPRVVAVMGCDISAEQAVQLFDYFRRVSLMLDDDDDGRRGGNFAAVRLMDVVAVERLKLYHRAPSQHSPKELREILTRSNFDLPL